MKSSSHVTRISKEFLLLWEKNKTTTKKHFIKSQFVPSVAFLEAFDTRFGPRLQCPHSSVSLFHAVVLIPVGTLFLSVSMVFSRAVS